MGKPILAAGLASAAAVYGSYHAAQSFVPGVAPVNENNSAALRGAQSMDRLESQVLQAESASGLKPMAVATGALALFALGSSRKTRVSCRAAAASTLEAPVEAPANAVEEPAPPPPFNPAEQLGVTAPLGFFDPLGFSKVGDEEGFRKLRAAELKHGRVAMMAAVGAVFQCPFQFPGFEKLPRGLGAITQEPAIYGLVAIVVLSGVFELFLWKEDAKKPVDDIGNYGNPWVWGAPLGEGADMKNRELNNGRAAMIAILGIIVAELATGKNACQQLGFN